MVGEGLLSMAKWSKRNPIIPASLIAIVLILAGYIIWSSGFLATPSVTSVQVDIESEACEGKASLLIEVTDAEGKRVPDAFVDISIDNQYYDSLYTDRNGMVKAEARIEREWCGEDVSFSARFRGDERYLPSQGSADAAVRTPTLLTLSMPNESVEGETVNATVHLSDGLSGDDLGGKAVLIDGRISITDSDGKAMFQITFNKTGERTFTAGFKGDSHYECKRHYPPPCLR
jgi:hypothetical protein